MDRRRRLLYCDSHATFDVHMLACLFDTQKRRGSGTGKPSLATNHRFSPGLDHAAIGASCRNQDVFSPQHVCGSHTVQHALVAIAIRTSVKFLQPINGAWRCTGLKACHLAAILLLCLSVGNVAYLVSYSPLFCRYQHWNDSAKISAIFLEKLAKLVGKLPKNGVIHICDLPEGISSYNDKHPRAKEVTYIRDYSIKSWLDLRFPGNTFKVLVHRRSWPRTFSGYLDLKSQRSSFNAVWVFVSVQARPPARLGMNPQLKWRVAGRHYF